MDELIKVSEKSLADYQATIGKKDNLVGTGEIILSEFKKQREQIITLGRLLADAYAEKKAAPSNVVPIGR